MSEHKVYNGRKNELVRQNRTKSLLNIAKKFMVTIAVVLFLNQALAFVTGYNILWAGIKYLLNSIDIYTGPVPSITIESDGWSKKEPGSWHIDKSAEWTGLGKAKVTFDIDTNMKTEENLIDVVLVLDTSGSMAGDKIQKVREDAIELTKSILSNTNNRVALINFSDKSEIKSMLTKDRDKLISEIEILLDNGNTNYNAALENVGIVLDGYKKEENRDLVVLFLTDGYPNVDTPNQVATYHYLKDQYPYMIMNGIQYEMGSDIADEIIEISDNQFYADMETLENILFEASLDPESYEKFIVTDYIDDEYFYINDINDIKVTKGTIKLEDNNNKIIWDLGTNFKTGTVAKMEINLTLKDEYLQNHKVEFYPTNKKEEINSKLAGEKEEANPSNLTPVLQGAYAVTYDINLPSECKDNQTIKTYHKSYEIVDISEETERLNETTCSGYIFKGWEIDEKKSGNVKRINEDVFEMPVHDVTVRAIWTKPVISKSMDGLVHKSKMTLYETIEYEYLKGRDYVGLYEGEATDSFLNPLANENIYYYHDNIYYNSSDYLNKTYNHVIFGGVCWQIVRTTASGGVRMIYNGRPVNGQCTATNYRDRQVGTIGYSASNGSMGYVGYMYNEEAAAKYKVYNSLTTGISYDIIKRANYTVDFNGYFSDDIEWTGSSYKLKNKDGSEVEQKKWGAEYENSHGHYMCSTGTLTCSSVYYIAGGDDGHVYYVSLSGGNKIENVDYEIHLGKNYKVENNGTYTLENVTSIKMSNWFVSNYNTFKDYYICSGYRSTNCNEILQISTTSNYQMGAIVLILYGSDVVYNRDTNTYSLTNPKKYSDLNGDLSSHHYTCGSLSDSCSVVDFIYSGYSYNGMMTSINYIKLTNGDTVNDALKQLFAINANNSNVKTYVDSWYSSNLSRYTSYLDLDAVYCNDRTISEPDGWSTTSKLSTNSGQSIRFGAYHRTYVSNKTGPSLVCTNITDRFSTTNSQARLTYPVALLTEDERYLYGGDNYEYSLYDGGNYPWTMSPYGYNYNAQIFVISGRSYIREGYNSLAVKPVVTLKAGIEYSSGNGTTSNPYVIATN